MMIRKTGTFVPPEQGEVVGLPIYLLTRTLDIHEGSPGAPLPLVPMGPEVIHIPSSHGEGIFLPTAGTKGVLTWNAAGSELMVLSGQSHNDLSGGRSSFQIHTSP